MNIARIKQRIDEATLAIHQAPTQAGSDTSISLKYNTIQYNTYNIGYGQQSTARLCST